MLAHTLQDRIVSSGMKRPLQVARKTNVPSCPAFLIGCIRILAESKAVVTIHYGVSMLESGQNSTASRLIMVTATGGGLSGRGT